MQWFGSLLCLGFDPWPGNFYMSVQWFGSLLCLGFDPWPRELCGAKKKSFNFRSEGILNTASLSPFFFFLWLHLWHMEIHGLGVKLELWLRLTPQPQYHQIQATSATHATVLRQHPILNLRKWGYGLNSYPHSGNIRSLTPWATVGTPTLNLFFIFRFLGLHLQHMEIPALGVESELQLLAYTTAKAIWARSRIRSELRLWPTPQLMARLDL